MFRGSPIPGQGTTRTPLTPVTIRKTIATLWAVWNWAAKSGLLSGAFPNSGVRYPKGTEKPHFQTWKEIEMQIARGGLSDAEQADLWDCLFLTVLGRRLCPAWSE